MIALPRARELALRALEIDDTVVVGHANLAAVTMYYDWNWKDAEEYILKGLRLNPNSGWDHWYYAMLLQATNRFEKAIEETNRALELDPFNPFMNIAFGELLFISGKYDQALEKLLWACDMYPNNPFAHLNLAKVYRAKELYNDAIKACEKAVLLSGGVPLTISQLACLYHETDRGQEADEHIQQLEQRRETEYVPCTCFVPYIAGWKKPVMNEISFSRLVFHTQLKSTGYLRNPGSGS
jgi:tetratricopeptide (TPR) repeat protein